MSLRVKRKFTICELQVFKKQLFSWGKQFETIVWLDSNEYKQNYTSFEGVLAVDEFTSIKTDYKNAFEKLKEYQSLTKDYIFGYVSYDVKNDVEDLQSTNHDELGFSDLFFFQPQKLIFIYEDNIEFHYLNMVADEIIDDYNTIINVDVLNEKEIQTKKEAKIKLRIHKDQYYKKVTNLLNHIRKGDLYEANFCQEFYAENVHINPFKTYEELNSISEAPFATFLKVDECYVLSASPERYIKKEGIKVISQPIKGTAKRGVNRIEDEKEAFRLVSNEKERAENIMIVDLVRNDLAKTALKGSVKVEELCKVYSFKQVHQLISTIVSEVDSTVHPIDVLKDTFPMGSMTGAPKISAMKIIEDLEETKRGLYSGSVGYFTPDGDFDFNVIIRSILYNEEKKYVSFSVGSAITAKSSPEKEYEECLLKAKAMKEVLLNVIK